MSRFDPDTHRRRSVRLPGYDYAQAGWYFVTVCTHDRALLFGDVVNGAMQPNDLGEIVAEEWARTAAMRPTVTVDAFVTMPNHIHGIIVIGRDRGTLQRAPTSDRVTGTLQRAPTVSGADAGAPRATTTERFGKPTPNSIPTIVRLFKSATTRRINARRGLPGVPVWQRNYYEHIIRDETSLHRIRQYIGDNPGRWDRDPENPA